MSSVLIVRDVDLVDAPEAFRQYVEMYFRKKKIWGQSFWVAATYVIEPAGGYRKGHAPSHSVDLSRFTQGLVGLSLNDWINRMTGENNEYLRVVIADQCSGGGWMDD